MRYLLAENQKSEIKARCEYLYDIFQLYFIPQYTINGFIQLVPFGTAGPSILFIVGHQNQVMHFLKLNIKRIDEKSIVMVTCFANSFKRFKKSNKKMYVSVADKALSYRYYGQDYGFNFDITKSELDFYNSSKVNIMQRLNSTFQRI